MPQSLAQILVHLVFSTKNREACLNDADRDELHGYIGGIIAHQGGVLLKAGSVADHIHLLLAHPRTCAPADLVREIKSSATIWLKSRNEHYRNFHWQAGYGMFSISPAHLKAVEEYIAAQAEHHRKISFQEEYRNLLQKYDLFPMTNAMSGIDEIPHRCRAPLGRGVPPNIPGACGPGLYPYAPSGLNA